MIYYKFIYEEREEEKGTWREGEVRDFRELAHMLMESAKSRICRMSRLETQERGHVTT